VRCGSSRVPGSQILTRASHRRLHRAEGTTGKMAGLQCDTLGCCYGLYCRGHELQWTSRYPSDDWHLGSSDCTVFNADNWYDPSSGGAKFDCSGYLQGCGTPSPKPFCDLRFGIAD
jgi:hypothetical protein